MVHISKLKLSGFKSFVEKTELDIGNGLNGIVGPNGCGKSNLVEALRWVMGESSARRIRGGDMEDVIFAGTTNRPARSIAEVSLTLDNHDLSAPAPFSTATQIEVTRRIERGKGSTYQVNGKTVRARDVQLLFADSLTGAHSPALISQGRVTQLIQAKATERRHMLEESAGVASLYTRRHEAELRLKAASENLVRLDDVTREMESRLLSLKRQARQALRYSEISETIRRLDATVLWHEWTHTRDRKADEEKTFARAEEEVRRHLLTTGEMTRANEEAAEKVVEAREAEIEVRAGLQKLKLTLDHLNQMEESLKTRHDEALSGLSQAETDRGYADEQLQAASSRRAVIEADLGNMEANETESPKQLEVIEAELSHAVSSLHLAESAYITAQGQTRARLTERDMAMQALQQAQNTFDRLARQRDEAAAALTAAEGQNDTKQALAAKTKDAAAHKAAYARLEAQAESLQLGLETTREAKAEAVQALRAAEQEKTRITNEIKGLERLIASISADMASGDLLDLNVPDGLEKALARAAGEAALSAVAGDDGATCHWRHTQADPAAWAKGVVTLADCIDAPAPLTAFLKSVALADDDAAGETLAANLKAGQAVVTPQGALWRWDGLYISATYKADHAALAMENRNRLAALEKDRAKGDAAVERAQDASEKASAAANKADDEFTATRSALRDARFAMEQADREVAQLTQAAAKHDVQLATLRERAANLAEQADKASEALGSADGKTKDASSEKALELLRLTEQNTRQSVEEKRGLRDALQVKAEALRADIAQTLRLKENLARELLRTVDQAQAAQTRLTELDARITNFRQRLDVIAEERVALDVDARNDIMSRIEANEKDLRLKADKLIEAERNAQTFARTLRESEEMSVKAREARAAAQAALAALREETDRVEGVIAEKFNGATPQALEQIVLESFEEEVPAFNAARRQRDEALAAREAMGPVNLRASIEADEAETELTKLIQEKLDLEQAIDRLKQGIAKLNGEARVRLLSTFEHVNSHFAVLFRRLFGGGEARLALIDADDPLTAGLEIFAQPPGKSLQSLSLLSGGEQTLTALALVFAMFLANPSPVCVLDEVDAPLDDANVDRMCSLLEEIANRTATRFLVISHHRMTMARMDRLYGVTMAERGVSQLVSVNLALQGELLARNVA